jgi:hypothetical protein
MQVVYSNQHESRVRIREGSDERVVVSIGAQLDIVLRNRKDGTTTITMMSGKQIVEKTFYPNTANNRTLGG